MPATRALVLRMLGRRIAMLALFAGPLLGACSDTTKPTCGRISASPVAVDAPSSGAIVGAARQFYAGSVPVSGQYSVSVSAITDPSVTLAVYDNGCFGSPVSTTVAGASPQELRQTIADSIWFVVSASPSGGNVASFSALLTPIAAPGSTQSESIAVAKDIPFLGKVKAGGTSHYWAAGLVSGVSYAVTIVALTDDAVLHVYADANFATELDCTRLAVHVAKAPQECDPVSDGGLHFTVSNGAGAVGGARYEVIVTRR